ncbi:hypothetical protein [Synechocystis sp. LKSZ1]|uniref:hypothetical protein n=1 Tax=Synechocystis sp. LKSZ1 TaxID=3144951 RepID=UPI00336BFE7B
MTVPKTLSLQQRSWQVEDFLPVDYGLPSGLLTQLDQDLHRNCVRLLGRDVYSEGDSQPLFDYLQPRWAEFTPGFRQLMTLWLADEQKHYQALRRVYQLLTRIPEEEMNQCFARRHHEIEPIQALLADEFTILVALLFDELGSTISYRRDLREYYRHYGPAVTNIAKQLVMDEGIHFQNAAQILQTYHDKRLGELPALLHHISRLEKSLGRYCKTFFLDHAQEQERFPPDFNEVIIAMILAHFDLGPSPRRGQYLWAWKPAGQAFTPLVA